MTKSLPLSQRAQRTEEQPISYFIREAFENPRLISLAAGLVDAESLPTEEVRTVAESIFADPASARAAMQYGATQGYAPLRAKILDHVLALDSVHAKDLNLSADDVVVTTGSQQLLYLVGEVLIDPGDIVITEAPSYFVYQGALASFGARTLQIPMDDEGMQTDALEELLVQLERTGELARVKMIYTVDYFQNPTGLTLSLPRRRHLMELVRRFSKKQRIMILEDAAYRELRFDGPDVPSIKSLDPQNEYVILGMTFSKPFAPGLKTGYGVMPPELRESLLRFKGNHDFGSSNLNQHILDRMMSTGAYQRQGDRLRQVYRAKRDAMLAALAAEFPPISGVTWTKPDGGLYVWWSAPRDMQTGFGSPLIQAGLDEGVLYIPGELCYEKTPDVPTHEARLCFGVATPAQIGEAIRRLARAARAVGLPRLGMKAFAGCRG